MFSANDLHRTLLRLTPAHSRDYVVALSGGADSSALLVAMASLRSRLGAAGVRAVHVNHGLQSAAAEFMARCEQLCSRYEVPLQALPVQLTLESGRSLEEIAREARYAALERNLGEGELLLTAHHRQDQAETFLLQALRGAGPAGLSAMPAVRALDRGWHLRPLLQVSRADIRDFLQAQGVAAIEDVMNADLRFDRAYLRQVIWPPLQQRWPAAAAVVSRAAAHVAQSQSWCEAMARQDLDAIRDGAAISISRLRHLNGTRQIAVLRAFIAASQARAPSQARLEEALRQMLDARGDRMPAIRWAQHALRRYRDRLCLTPASIGKIAACEWDWRAHPVCELSAGLGRLRVRAHRGGLNAAHMPARLRVQARAGGEWIKPESAAATHAVRQLFQQRGIVPWMRDAIPFVFAADSLLAVADLWTDARYCASPGNAGVGFVWEDAPLID